MHSRTRTLGSLVEALPAVLARLRMGVQQELGLRVGVLRIVVGVDDESLDVVNLLHYNQD